MRIPDRFAWAVAAACAVASLSCAVDKMLPAPAKRTESRRAPAPAAPFEPGTPPDGTGPFPTPDQLAELGQAPAAEDLFTLTMAPVDEWTLEGPFPDRTGVLPVSDASPAGVLLDEFAATRSGLVVPSAGMFCVAREMGRFYLAKRAQPTESLRGFITARCHAGIGRIASGYVSGDVAPGESDEQIFERWKDSIERNLTQHSVGGVSSAGIWFGREGDHAVVMVAFGRRDLHIKPFSPFVPPGQPLEIVGEVLRPHQAIGALVNRGRYGVVGCELDPEVALPRFRFSCPIEPGDPAVLVAVGFTPPNRLLHETGLLAIVWSGKKTRETYRPPSYTDPHPVSPGDDVAGDFVELLNGVRATAGLDAVEIDRHQSEQAMRLAPHFFSGMLGMAPSLTSDLVVLGLMAGWWVDGIVQSGHFASAWATQSTDLGRLLSSALELPGTRETLLAPEIERIAVGPILGGPEGQQTLAAVIATYSLFSEQTHEENARGVLARLKEQRKDHGLPGPERLEGVSQVFQQAAAAVQAGQDPADALRVLLEASAQRLRRPVSGWITEVSDLDLVEFPEEYVTRPTLGVEVAVSHRKQPGDAWGHWVVMLVVAGPQAQGA